MKMNNFTATSSPTQNNLAFVTFITLVATLGGLLFGYDTAVISGAIGLLKHHFNLSALQVGWAASSALLGCVVGAALAGKMSNQFGRRISLMAAALLFLISAIGTALPESYTIFVFYRIIGGAGVGIASMLSPMYIAEIAPSNIRGRLVSYNQFAIIAGMLLVYFVNYYIALQGNDIWNVSLGWRWMFASESIPATLFFICLFFVPESPRWLISKNKKDQGFQVLKKINNSVDHALAEVEQIQHSIKHFQLSKVSWKVLLKPNAFKLLLIGIALSVFQQVTGINVFLYYAPEIFKQMGSATDAALLQTIIVGAVNLGFTIIAILTVDKFGRKPLMLIGAIGMGICIFSIGTAAYFQNTDTWLLVFILGYIACFAMSLGPVTWVLLSEIFPNSIRGMALSIAVAAQWLSNFLVSQTFPMMMDNKYLFNHFHGGFPFWIYAIMCVFCAVFVWKAVPETKGKSLEEMDQFLSNDINTNLENSTERQILERVSK